MAAPQSPHRAAAGAWRPGRPQPPPARPLAGSRGVSLTSCRERSGGNVAPAPVAGEGCHKVPPLPPAPGPRGWPQSPAGVLSPGACRRQPLSWREVPLPGAAPSPTAEPGPLGPAPLRSPGSAAPPAPQPWLLRWLSGARCPRFVPLLRTWSTWEHSKPSLLHGTRSVVSVGTGPTPEALLPVPETLPGPCSGQTKLE